MRLKNFTPFFGIGVFAICTILIFCSKKKTNNKLMSSADAASKDFFIQCLGSKTKNDCTTTEISVTNISQKSYSNLILICTDKDSPNASERDPYYIFPFSLEPNETKCMEAASNCFKKKHKDKELGDFFTLILLDSDNEPIWKLGNNCDSKEQIQT